MDERTRRREVLGTTTLACPYCKGGPMMVTRSERVRRLLDRVNPRFDPDVLHHEVCSACRATFLVSADRIADVLQSPVGGPPGPERTGAPSPPTGSGNGHRHVDVGASVTSSTAEDEPASREPHGVEEPRGVETATRGGGSTSPGPPAGATGAAARLRAEAEVHAQAGAPSPPRAVGIAERAEERARLLVEAWGGLPAAPPPRSRQPGHRVLVGGRAPVGAGRRSGPVRRPQGDGAD